MALKKICSKQNCNTLIDADLGSRCDKHSIKQDIADRNRLYDQYVRDPRSTQFYRSTQWKKLREVAFRRDNGLCQDCLDEKRFTKGDVVDHQVPIKVDWSLRLTLSNLRTLCHRHHNTKTADDKQKYGI
ncbi:HNH endonuclease [Paenibacillus sp. NPDC093718]|uniref:HNH endonuclease n=1 Tax=Paenibacillus sp. NPDC093718 TaxID=3390601 RepID=UPI003CFE7450